MGPFSSQCLRSTTYSCSSLSFIFNKFVLSCSRSPRSTIKPHSFTEPLPPDQTHSLLLHLFIFAKCKWAGFVHCFCLMEHSNRGTCFFSWDTPLPLPQRVKWKAPALVTVAGSRPLAHESWDEALGSFESHMSLHSIHSPSPFYLLAGFWWAFPSRQHAETLQLPGSCRFLHHRKRGITHWSPELQTVSLTMSIGHADLPNGRCWFSILAQYSLCPWLLGYCSPPHILLFCSLTSLPPEKSVSLALSLRSIPWLYLWPKHLNSATIFPVNSPSLLVSNTKTGYPFLCELQTL